MTTEVLQSLEVLSGADRRLHFFRGTYLLPNFFGTIAARQIQLKERTPVSGPIFVKVVETTAIPETLLKSLELSGNREAPHTEKRFGL